MRKLASREFFAAMYPTLLFVNGSLIKFFKFFSCVKYLI